MVADRIQNMFIFLFCVLLAVTLCQSAETNEGSDKSQTPAPNKNNTVTVSSTVGTTNTTASKKNETETGLNNFIHKLQDNKGMLLRTFYVLMGVTAIVVVYFIVRAWRSRRRKNKSRKYGLITASGNDLEMEPLDQDDDDDEDMTVFEVNNRARK